MKEIVNQLSAREKKLLYVLVCFLLVIGSWLYLISPMLEKGTELKVEYETLLTENTNKKMELAKVQAAPQQLSIKKESLRKIIEKYNPILKDEKIDKLLTTLVLKNGLNPKSLQIGEITDMKITDEQNKDKKDTTQTSYVKQVQVNLTVSGNLNQMTKAIDDLNKMDGTQISGFNYSESINNDTTLTTATINVVLYMAQQ